MILTNRFRVDYHMAEIDRDFDIFVVEREAQKLDRTSLLDLASQKYHALAVQYAWGSKAFVLFQKHAVSEREYQTAVMQEDTKVRVRKVDLLNEEETNALFYYQKRLLLQLLCNSIHTPRSKRFSYHNLTGKLNYRLPK